MKKIIFTIVLMLSINAATATDSTASYHLKKAAVNRGLAIASALLTAIAASQVDDKDDLPMVYLCGVVTLSFEIASISHTYKAGRALKLACGAQCVGLKFTF